MSPFPFFNSQNGARILKESADITRSLGVTEDELQEADEYAEKQAQKAVSFLESGRPQEEIVARLRENAQSLRAGTPPSQLNWD
jgi:hypothetical protein